MHLGLRCDCLINVLAQFLIRRIDFQVHNLALFPIFICLEFKWGTQKLSKTFVGLGELILVFGKFFSIEKDNLVSFDFQ